MKGFIRPPLASDKSKPCVFNAERKNLQAEPYISPIEPGFMPQNRQGIPPENKEELGSIIHTILCPPNRRKRLIYCGISSFMTPPATLDDWLNFWPDKDVARAIHYQNGTIGISSVRHQRTEGTRGILGKTTLFNKGYKFIK